MSVSITDNFLDVEYIDEFLTEDHTMILFERFIKDATSASKRSKVIYGDQHKKYVVNFRGKTVEYPMLPWDPYLLEIKEYLEQKFEIKLTVCVVSIYPTGTVCIKPHRDKEMVTGTKILGVSIGDVRTLRMSNWGKQHDISLKNGSIYIFNPPTNDYWSHEILPSNSTECRICFTFRNY